MINWREYNIAPFKEPRGFLKLLEWLFAICAFASTVDFSTKFTFTAMIACAPDSKLSALAPLNVSKTVSYPFALDQPSEYLYYNTKDIDICKNTSTPTSFHVQFFGNVRSDSEFFVTTGVLCFLYSTVMIGIYLYADKAYMDSPNGSIIDFVFTVIFALFWLSGTAAWCKGVSDLKYSANPRNWMDQISIYIPQLGRSVDTSTIVLGSYGGLTVSILFGFINFILWATNLWFLYKETPWYESIMKRAAPASAVTTSPTASA